MRRVVAVAFIILALLAGFFAVACLGALPDAVRNASHEPEDVLLLRVWLAVTASLLVLWATGALRLMGLIRRIPRPVEYLGVAIMAALGCAIAYIAAGDPLDGFMFLPGLLIVASAVAYTCLRRLERTPANPALQPTPQSRRG